MFLLERLATIAEFADIEMNAGNVFFAKKYEVIIATHDQLKHTFFILYLNRRDHRCLCD